MKAGLGWTKTKNDISLIAEILASLGGALSPKMRDVHCHCRKGICSLVEQCNNCGRMYLTLSVNHFRQVPVKWTPHIL